MGPSGDDLAASVGRGSGVDLTGPPLSGRSTQLRVAADRLRESGHGVVEIAGVHALRDRPLVALALADLGEARPVPATVPDVTRRLLQRLTSPRPVVVVDDVDDLDEVSAGVLQAVSRTPDVVLLTSRRTGSEALDPVRRLLGGLPPAVTRAMGGMPFAELHRLVHDLLPGAVDPGVVARVAVLSGGLPGLVTHLVAVGRAQGALRLHGGLWRMQRELVPAELAQTLAPFLRDLDHADVEGLTVLALAGAQPVATAARLADAGVVDRLETAGLLATTSEGTDEVLTVVPPVLGEYLAATCAPVRRSRLEARIAAALAGAPLVPATRGVRAGVADSVFGKRLADHWELERQVLHDAWEDDPTPQSAVPLLLATIVSGRGTSPREVLRRTRRDGAGTEVLDAWFAMYVAVHEQDAAAATEHLAGVPGDLSAAAAAHVEFLFERVPEVPHRPAGTTAAGPAAEAWEAVTIECELARGLVTTARARAERFTPRCPALVTHRAVTLALARVLAGEVADGVEQALLGAGAARAALDPGAIQAHAYVAALGLTLAGRFAELDAVVASALTATSRTALEEHYRAGVLSLAAVVAGWEGRRAYGRRLALQARALDHRSGPYPGIVPGALLALARVGDLGAASEELWAAAEQQLGDGYVTAAIFAGVASVERRPDVERARRLDRAASATESPVLRALGAYALAMSAQDEPGLVAARDELLALGVRTYGVRASVSYALLLRRWGRGADALAQVEEAWALATSSGAATSGLFEPYVRALDLSVRELEVVEMAATGLTTPQIAAELVLSPRTVENHLLTSYRKVGVDNREDLRRAVATWLVLPR